MRRRVSQPQATPGRRPRKARLVGDMVRWFTEEDLAARLACRVPIDGIDVEVIEALAGQFEDVKVPAGYIRASRLRRDRLYVTAYMLRRQGLPPRKVAQALGLSRPYVKQALRRGKALVESLAPADPRLADALQALHHQDHGEDR